MTNQTQPPSGKKEPLPAFLQNICKHDPLVVLKAYDAMTKKLSCFANKDVEGRKCTHFPLLPANTYVAFNGDDVIVGCWRHVLLKANHLVMGKTDDKIVPFHYNTAFEIIKEERQNLAFALEDMLEMEILTDLAGRKIETILDAAEVLKTAPRHILEVFEMNLVSYRMETGIKGRQTPHRPDEQRKPQPQHIRDRAPGPQPILTSHLAKPAARLDEAARKLKAGSQKERKKAAAAQAAVAI